MICLFACCREIYNTNKHCGFFGGSEQQAHVYFDKRAHSAAEASKSSPEAIKKQNEYLLERLAQYEAID